MVKVKEIIIYPVKSCAGIHLNVSKIDKNGLELDRIFVLIDQYGKLLTTFTQSKLVVVSQKLIKIDDKIYVEISTETMDKKLILDPKPSEYGAEVTVDIWESLVQGHVVSEEASNWFSTYLGIPVQLLIKGKQPRIIKPFYVEKADLSDNVISETAFANSFPLLIISEKSIQSLKTYLPEEVKEEINLSNFRPNIVLSECEKAYEEDQYLLIKINNIDIHCDIPCARCLFPNVNSKTGILHPTEPSKTLMQVRRAFPNIKKFKAFFGVNGMPLDQGEIQVGQIVEIISLLEK